MSEKLYDEEIAPVLLELSKKCKENGMSMVATIEYEPEKRGITRCITDESGLAMQMLSLCSATGENLDAYVMNLVKMCKAKGIDTSQSIVIRLMGLDASTKSTGG